MLPADLLDRLRRLGLDEDQADVYASLVGKPQLTPRALAAEVGRDVAEVERDLAALEARGLLHRRNDVVDAVSPDRALGALLESRMSTLQAEQQSLEAVRADVGRLEALYERARMPAGDPAWVEVLPGSDPARGAAMMSATVGEMLWLRPDSWRHDWGRAMDRVVAAEIAAGRSSRAIYPMLVLDEAPEVLYGRAAAGEDVRLLPEVPFRLVVVEGLASQSEATGSEAARWVVVRHPALVTSMRSLFEVLWQRATPVRGLGRSEAEARADPRELLLALLALGAKDEQMARSLGVSLRTVRRRVAELLEELGAESRFQAGAEAVRRGLV